MPDDHSACDCTKQDDIKVRAGGGDSGEANDVKEYAEMGARHARDVRGSGVACTVNLCTCIRG
jgi:hypothetical protein